MIPQEPSLGDATKITDDVVGIMTNGVLLDSHSQTWSYDMCNGHSDTKHQYHYHIPPICYLESMGVSVPQSASWWINDEGTAVRPYEDMSAQFPAMGSSPVVGFARDGHPIKALYDSSGALQRSAPFNGDLDECNGKEDGDGYAYYITAEPPFVPTCLRGNVGSFSSVPTDKVCPKDGIKNTIEGLSAEGTQEVPPGGGEDPSGEDPSGEDTSGEDTSGEDPSGEDPASEDTPVEDEDDGSDVSSAAHASIPLLEAFATAAAGVALFV